MSRLYGRAELSRMQAVRGAAWRPKEKPEPADSDEFTNADRLQFDKACMDYMRRATGHIRQARLTPQQRALARKNRKLWAEGYTARLEAAERVFAVDQ